MGDRFLDPKSVPRTTPFLGTQNLSGIYVICRKKKAHPPIHPESPGLPQLDIAVAGRASHMDTPRDKMSIGARPLLLVMQTTACASVLELGQAHSKPDS